MASLPTSGDTELLCLAGSIISIQLTDGKTFSGQTKENLVLRQIADTNDDASDTPTSPRNLGGIFVGDGIIVTGPDRSPTSENPGADPPSSPVNRRGLFLADKDDLESDDDSKSEDKDDLKSHDDSKAEDPTKFATDKDDFCPNNDDGSTANNDDDSKSNQSDDASVASFLYAEPPPGFNYKPKDSKDNEAEDDNPPTAPTDKPPTGPPTDDLPTAPTDELTTAPTDDLPIAPTDNPPNAPADNPPTAPTDNPPTAPTDDPPSAPTDHPPTAPMDDPPNAPVDDPPTAPTDDPPPTAPTDDHPPTAPTDNPPTAPVDDHPTAPTDSPAKSKKRSVNEVTSDSEMPTSGGEESEDDVPISEDDDYSDDSDTEVPAEILVRKTKRLKQYRANNEAPYTPKKDEVPSAATRLLADSWHNDPKNREVIDQVNRSNVQPDSHFELDYQAKKLYPWLDSVLSYLNRGTTRLSRQIELVELVSKKLLSGKAFDITQNLVEEDDLAMVIKLLNVLTKKLARRKSKSDVVAYIVSNYELRADTYYLESWYPGPWRRGEPTSAELYGAGLNSAA